MGHRWPSMMIALLFIVPVPALGLGVEDPPSAAPPGAAGRAFNATEHMAFTTTPPTIDGQLSFGEWDDAAVYDIAPGAAVVNLYIMFDAGRIYTAVDAIADVTQDLGDPGVGYIADFNNDYLLMAFDGDNDGVITYQNTEDGGGNQVMGEDAFTRGGRCVDRGVTSSGGTYRNAGWWNRHSSGTGHNFWSIGTPGPNQGSTEPFDYINTAFSTRRTYEHSIPYTGPGDELNLSRGDYINISIAVNDARAGSPFQIGAMPSGADGVTVFQQFMINSKPRAAIADPGGTLFYTDQSISFDGTPSKEPDMETMSYEWDLDYDGITFNVDSTSMTVSHSYGTEGHYTIALRVSDPHGARDLRTMDIEVVEPPMPPTISNADPTDFDISVDEGGSVMFKAEYNDPNLDKPTERLQVTWLVDDKVVKTENKTTPGMTSYTFQTAHTGANSAGTYVIKLRVNDTYDAKGKHTGGSLETIRRWNLTVDDVNRPPTIDSYSPNAPSVTTDEATPVAFSITRSDPDGDPLTVRWYLGATEIEANRDMSSYAFNSKPPDYDLAGNYVVKAVVSDGTAQVEVSWNLIVDDVNRAPTFVSVTPRSELVELDEGEDDEFSFTASDPDVDELTYTWYIGDEAVSTGTGEDAFYLFETAHLGTVGHDSSGSPYALKLEVTDGKATITKEWSIKVNDVNRPPVIVIAAPAEGGRLPITETVLFDATGTTDPDGDKLTYIWMAGDGDTEVGPKVGHQYTASGEYTVTLKVTDGRAEATKAIKIEIIVPLLKVDRITHDPISPADKDLVRISATIQNNGNMDAEEVTVSFYMDNPSNKIGTTTVKDITKDGSKDATMTWKAKSGRHRIIVKIEPSTGYEVEGGGEKELGLTVKAGATTPADIGLASPFMLVLLLVIVVVVIVVVIAVARRGRKEEDDVPAYQETPQPAPADPGYSEPEPIHPPPPSPEPEPDPTMDLPPLAPPPVPAAAKDVGGPILCRQCGMHNTENEDGVCDQCRSFAPAPVEEAVMAEERGAKPEPGPIGVTTTTKAVLTEDEGVEDFNLTEIFVVYEDGRLIDYATVKGGAEIDKDIISGMLVAIQNFVKTTMAAKKLNSFEMGEKKAVMERGRYLIMTCVLEGIEPPTLRDQMQDIVQKLEGLYAGIIEEWDGDSAHFKGLRRHLIPLFRLKSKMKIKEKEGKVQVKSAIEFYQGYVRLKVAVLNTLRTIITDAAFRLEWNKDALRLARTEPEYPMDGSTVILGNVKPGEKKTVAYYLDPIICQESYLDGTLMFFDSFGKKHTADMKRRPADIVCPIFYTMETVNVAMLKRLLKELDYSDSKVYEIDTRPTLKAAYRLAKQVVRGHDVKEVREFDEQKPFEAETWFYGETKATEEKIVIRVAARETAGYLEIFVASKNLASMTGLLAELGNEFRKKVLDQGIMTNVMPSIDEDIRNQIEQTMLLLDKYAEAEIGAGEIDLE